MKTKLGFAAFSLLAAVSVIACDGDDDVSPDDNTSSSSSSSSSSGQPGPTSSSSSSSSGSSSSSSSGSSSGDSGTACPAAPADYPGADTFAQRAALGVALRGSLQALNTKMTEAETASVAGGTTAVELDTLYAASAVPQVPSLKTLASDSRKATVAAAFTSFADAQGKVFNPTAATPTNGKLGTWLFDAKGIDLRQVVEKGSFGAEMFRITSSADPRPIGGRIDEIVAAFGTGPTFHGVSSPANPETDDVHVARYAFNRDRNGLYATFKTNAILAKHAAANGDACATELTTAVGEMKKVWEQTLAATTIYYLNGAGPNLTSATEATRNSALHQYGEAAGFITGLRALSAAERVATDAQLDAVLTAMNYAAGPIPFVTGALNAEEQFNDAINALKTAYSFTDAQITTFKGQ